MKNLKTLVAGVIASPEEDTPRRILLDWLEDREDPRAELLRAALDAGVDLPVVDPGEGAVNNLRYSGGRWTVYPLAELRRHGGNRAVCLLSALALRNRLRAEQEIGTSSLVRALWTAAAAAELFACGLATERHREPARAALSGSPPHRNRIPGRIHTRACLTQAAYHALGPWSGCNFVLELLTSSARRMPGVATLSERRRDAALMRVVIWRHVALAERLAVTAGRHPSWRHPAPRLAARIADCHHAYDRRPFGLRCSRCGHYTDRRPA